MPTHFNKLPKLLPLLFMGTFAAQAQNFADTTFHASVSEVMKVKPKNTLEDLLNRQITTASNSAEKISESPASTVVITQDDMRARGYTSLIDLLQDLPEMDVTVPYGDTYQRMYLRGYRTNIGNPYLFMIDGVIYNNLYFNQIEILAATPLSFIDRVEIVYGPASSVYGPNAFMGVINVITRKTSVQTSSVQGHIATNQRGFTWADLNFLYQKNKFKVSVTGRIEQGNVNQLVDAGNSYWLQDKWYADKRLWGDGVNNPTLAAGKFSSPVANRALDARVYLDKLEIGLAYYATNTGYGMVYPADGLVSNGKWLQPEISTYARYITNIGNKLISRTFLRYRESYLDNSSYDLEGYNITNNDTAKVLQIGNTVLQPKETARVMQVTYWASKNSSVSFYQDFELRLLNNLSIFTGLKYEVKDLQKAYETYSGDFFYPELLTNSSAIFPPMPPVFAVPQNRITWIDRGVYAQAKWQIIGNHILHAGFRFDENSAYGAAPTLRIGYTTRYNKLIFKAFYGEAFQEPTPRLLYGGWRGSGADPKLQPERSRTAELTVNYTTATISTDLNVYYVRSENAIVNFPGGAKNVGEREMLGLSIKTQGVIALFKETKWWANYSWILSENEQQFDSQGNKTEKTTIGDLAYHKIQFGITSKFSNRLSATLFGRFVGNREPVLTNPVRNLDAFAMFDTNIACKLIKGITASLKVINIFDTLAFTPGLRSADAGESGGTFVNRAWEGSNSFFNSRIPLPPRMFVINIGFDLYAFSPKSC
jgi:outer membrane receptor for ferrienterochelin and colicins